jgi:multiple sugar transport system permease protein
MLSKRAKTNLQAYMFVGPLLAVYTIFMVYPFFKNFWISLHEWNLLEVAFNPDAKEFIGIKNYLRTAWGRQLVWEFGALWKIQLLAFIGLLISGWGYLRRWWGLRVLIVGVLFSITLFILVGFQPSENGRWFDKRFWVAVRNTLVFVLGSVPPITLIGLLLAVLINYPNRVMGTFRTLFYLSSVLSVTVITLIWKFMFSPFQGLPANVMKALGREPIVWTVNPDLAMPSVIIATVWWVIGFPMIVLLAGLQDIPTEQYEAARIDGANAFALFSYITLPGLRRPLIFVLLYEVISQFQIFGQAHLLTAGGPGDATNTMVRYIYNTGFRDNEIGRAGAMAVFLFCLHGYLFFCVFCKFRHENKSTK